MKEEWRAIEGFSGYVVSNYGRVASRKRGTFKELSAQVSKWGYLQLRLFGDDGRRKTRRVNRLVAAAFVPNPDNKSQVNHIDGNKLNNRADNLEWVTASENQRHAYVAGLNDMEKCREAANRANRRRIIRSDGAVFDSLTEAAIAIGTSRGNVWQTCNNGPCKTIHGYSFRYA